VGQPPLLAAPVLVAGSTDTIKTGQPRVLRGGDFNSQPENLRSAYRLGYVPTIRLDDVGFRLARTIRP
jgi:formylglycine-generating enzyme required for sulfatase activity